MSCVLLGKDSENEHAITVGVEAVFLFNRLAIGLQGQFATCEGGNQHDEGGLRKVEIGEQGVDGFEAIGWMDEDVGFT